jgi:nickel-dependent lactate racemase
MPTTLRYGPDFSVPLELRDGAMLAECNAPRGEPLDDPGAAATQGLSEPLDYPPLARSTTPADRVVLPLGPDVPRAGEIAAAAVRSLVDAGVQPDGIAVLRTQAHAEAGIGDPRPWLSKLLNERISVVTHHPGRRAELAYLASTETGDPVFLNRTITDADVVLPLGCFRDRSAVGHWGIHSAVFPTFSDQRTLQRFRSPTSLDDRGHPKRKPAKIVDEVGWLLGVTLTMQVIPGAGDGVLAVLAGQTETVRQEARRLYDAAWRWSVPRQASLVVAAIEGGPAYQTWDNVGRALSAARDLVEDGGAIAVCCDLAGEPGPAVQHLAADRRGDEAMQWIRKERPVDAIPATLLAQTLDRVTVYLLSRLERSLVEDLQISPIAAADELVRLIGRHESCILLANAPHAMVTLDNEG